MGYYWQKVTRVSLRADLKTVVMNLANHLLLTPVSLAPSMPGARRKRVSKREEMRNKHDNFALVKLFGISLAPRECKTYLEVLMVVQLLLAIQTNQILTF